MRGLALVVLLLSPAAAKENVDMARDGRFARLALKCVAQEYPNKPEHVMLGGGDARGPKDLHPAFYGCYDWHSSVHGHWLLVKLLKKQPLLPEAAAIRAALDKSLRPEAIAAEVRYLAPKERRTFERTYGWAWLLKLREELLGFDDPDARRWAAALEPLAREVVARYKAFLPKQTYPIRTGVHPNTAFGLAFALDYARAAKDAELEALVVERALAYYGGDVLVPASWEPGGEDFFSPSLMEADLMRRVLPFTSFAVWIHKFFGPGGLPANLLEPAVVSDRSDPKLVHLDGLNLSRAWAMRSIAAGLPDQSPFKPALQEAARRHLDDALKAVSSGDYAGEHWLATFAVYALATPLP